MIGLRSARLLGTMLALVITAICPLPAQPQGISAPYKSEAPKPTLTGTVKWFNEAKGYGYITPDDGTADVYVHHSRVEIEGFKSLKKGQRVRFVGVFGRHGREAAEVQIVPDKPDEPPVQQ